MAIKTPQQLGPTRLVRAALGLLNPGVPVLGQINRLIAQIDQMLRSLFRAVAELQESGGLVHENVTLTNNSETTLAHGLGRSPVFVWVSPPRNSISTGRITETRDTDIDRNKFVQIGAYGWGADVVVDVWVIG